MRKHVPFKVDQNISDLLTQSLEPLTQLAESEKHIPVKTVLWRPFHAPCLYKIKTRINNLVHNCRHENPSNIH